MTILGIETSCDETSASVITGTSSDKNHVTLLSSITSSSLPIHAKTGGIIPERAAREQVKYLLPVIAETLQKGLGFDITSKQIPPIDAIAVTYGPGLIGSLLVGVETAKVLSLLWNKAIIPVNHMIGHIYANFISEKTKTQKNIAFPFIALVVSGGHTDLLLFKDHGKFTLLGGTRDDAAGEAFDKIGRLLNLSYPGGPAIEEAAKKGDAKAFRFPRPLHDSKDFDFSFSGLKTAVYREIQTIKQLNNKTIADISAAVQEAIIDVLVTKTMQAAKEYKAKSILLSGGVAANQMLREQMEQYALRHTPFAKIFVPQKSLCTDNAAMIATAAFFNPIKTKWETITADPQLYFSE